MLRPAQKYDEELRSKLIDIWYEPRYMYFNMNPYDCMSELPDNNADQHHFASIKQAENLIENDKVIGYIFYEVDWISRQAEGFGAVSFEIGKNLEFAKDLNQVVYDIFYKYNLNRMSWSCIVDNPALRGYKNFIKRHGGIQSGYKRECCTTLDGTLRDMVEFEILKREYIP